MFIYLVISVVSYWDSRIIRVLPSTKSECAKKPSTSFRKPLSTLIPSIVTKELTSGVLLPSTQPELVLQQK